MRLEEKSPVPVKKLALCEMIDQRPGILFKLGHQDTGERKKRERGEIRRYGTCARCILRTRH